MSTYSATLPDAILELTFDLSTRIHDNGGERQVGEIRVDSVKLNGTPISLRTGESIEHFLLRLLMKQNSHIEDANEWDEDE